MCILLSAQEALVVAHEHLRLECADGLKCNTDNDDDGRAAQGDAGELLRLRARADDQRRDRDDAQVDRAEERDLVEHLLDEFARRLACTEARDEPTVLLQVVGDLDRVELDRGVEVAEEDDEQEVDDDIRPGGRIKDVLHHFLGADQNNYVYEAMKDLLLGAISRVYRPGTKFEYMLILVGGQGAGKSTFFRFLAMNDSWFTDDLKKLDDENVFRKMQGHLIIELSEMIATASARSIEDIKSFISRQSDIYKVPYETQPKDRPRQCVFGGTSNAMDTLPLDRTGNRRFMPVMVYPDRAECHILKNEELSRKYIEQVWAEAMEIYRSGEFRLMLSRESAEYLKDYQKQFMPEDADAGMILAFLDNFKGDRVCSKMLWKEALHRDYEPKRIELKQICDIMNNSVTDWIMSDGAMHFGVYGKQRGWVRAGFSQGIPDKADSDGFMAVPKQLELEIPFK